ncbi:BamA/TamA family outer membrane protein [Candidatus Dependentiae bacterium]|nr:BamA/TamA family outer membrane protein [Candidatus Dependentiae bacterium]
MILMRLREIKNLLTIILFSFIIVQPTLDSKLEQGCIDVGNSFTYQPDSAQYFNYFIDKITYQSDISLSSAEFFYLVGLKPKSWITNIDLDLAYKNLSYKKRFKNIEIEINKTNKSFDLYFKLTSHWIFRKLILGGVLFGKHKYTILYQLQPGDVFDINLHEDSVKEIKSYLYGKGYFNCQIRNELIYQKNNKSITTKIDIKKNKPFIIRQLDFTFVNLKNNHLEKLSEKLETKIGNNLLNKVYAKSLIEKEVKRIKNYFKKRGFLDCHISLQKLIHKDKNFLNLNFRIKLGKQQRLKFFGNSIFTNKQINEEIIGQDYPSWYFSPEIIAEQILHEYYKKGYWNTVINYNKTKDNFFEFRIVENQPTIINRIKVYDISKNETTIDPVFFVKFLKRAVFDEQALNESILNLKKFYLEKGYWNFQVIDKQLIKNNYDKYYTLILNIKSNEQRLWSGFKIEKFEFLEKNEFFKNYFKTTEKNIPFNFYWLSEQKNFLLNYFQQKGYWYVDVYPEFKLQRLNIAEEKLNIFVKWIIKLGPKIKFGKVLLKGNTRLPFSRIIQEVQFKESETWNKQKIDTTRYHLKRLDIFKHVQLHPYKISEKKNSAKELKLPVILTLMDEDPIQARCRLGYFLTSQNFLFKRESTYKVGASLIFSNPTNNADKLDVNADFTKFERKIDFDYQIPSPFGIKIKNSSLLGKFKTYSNKYIHPVEILNSDSAYEAHQDGFYAGLSNEYKKGYFCGINLGNEWINTSKVRGNLKFSKNLINKTTPYFFIEPNFVIDNLDDRLDTKSGSLTFFALKTMIPEYYRGFTGKIMFEQSLFYPVYNKLIAAFRIRWGHIFKTKFEDVQPPERFYLGGSYSVRGYEKDALPPIGIGYKLNDKNQLVKTYTIQGGSSMVNGNIELRFPIYKSLKGVIFTDIGVLSQSGFCGFYGKWYPASGFGIRYKTPIGPIRFDIGWKWKNRLPGDSSYAWYLTLGEAF